jgi:hypothetical protein
MEKFKFRFDILVIPHNYVFGISKVFSVHQNGFAVHPEMFFGTPKMFIGTSESENRKIFVFICSFVCMPVNHCILFGNFRPQFIIIIGTIQNFV